MAVDREAFKQMLKEKGLKVTEQRLLMLEIIAAHPGEHLTAEEIFSYVKVVCPKIGLATVYRTIQLLNELGLIDRVNFDDGFVRYEMGSSPNHGQKHHHHHLICEKCGRVFAFQDDLLEELEERIAVTTGFFVVNHEVKLYGYCKACREILEREKRWKDLEEI